MNTEQSRERKIWFCVDIMTILLVQLKIVGKRRCFHFLLGNGLVRQIIQMIDIYYSIWIQHFFFSIHDLIQFWYFDWFLFSMNLLRLLKRFPLFHSQPEITTIYFFLTFDFRDFNSNLLMLNFLYWYAINFHKYCCFYYWIDKFLISFYKLFFASFRIYRKWNCAKYLKCV